MIPEETVQKVIDTADIVEVIGEFVNLHKTGANYKGLCPFHNEKTPSFLVSPSKQIFKCFGCGESGSAVGFLMKYEHLSFIEAIKWLAKKYNIEIEEKELSPEELAKLKENETINAINTFAQNHFIHNLENTVEGQTIAYTYFKERGFTDETIKKFKLGYALDKYTDLIDAALKKGYKVEQIEKAGLAISKTTSNVFINKVRYYDRFRNRVIFPIHSLSGKVIAFGGRILGNKDKNTAKYINSPETPVYNKSRSLYGIFFAKNEIVRQDKCYLVEGYTDVISMHQAGITNVVASSGTSLTEDQIRLIRRFTKNMTLIFDGDKAGLKAALRGINLVLKEDLNVRIVLLPQDEDPDSFAKKHTKQELVDYLEENEKDFILFKIGLLNDAQLSDPVRKSEAIKDIIASIAVIPDEVKKDNYIKESARLLNIKEEIIYSEINKILKKEESKINVKSVEVKPKYEKITPDIPNFINENAYPEEKQLIFLMLNFGERFYDEEKNQTIADYIITEVEVDGGFRNLIYKEIFDIYKEKLENNEKIDIKYFLNHPDDRVREISAKVYKDDFELSKFWKKNGTPVLTPEDTYVQDTEQTIIAFKMRVVELFIEKQREALKTPDITEEEMLNITQRIAAARQITQKLMDLGGRRNIYKI